METKAIRASQLRARMFARGVTVSALAREAGLYQPNVSDILAGRLRPGVIRTRKLGEAIVRLGLDEDPAPDPDEPVIPVPIRIRQL